MRARNRLSAAFVKRAPAGKWCDGAGLWLVKRDDGGAQWVLRYTLHGRRREMGLGGGDVPLAEARRIAERWRAVAAVGRDPMKERDAEIRAARRDDITLAVLTADAFEARKSELRDEGKAGRWMSPLEVHVLPKLGKVPVTDIDQRDIRDVLAPIWHGRGAESAEKALNRIGIVLKHAAALGLEVDLQAPAKARALLGKSRRERKHIPAVHWRDVPTFYATLAEPTITHLALRLVILTGVRSKAIRFLRLDQIDGDVWIAPAEIVKGRKGKTVDFHVPLSPEALRVIELARPFERYGYLFPSARKGVISDATMARLMERRGMDERPHGFRSSLRDWLADCTEAPHEVAETVLGHVAGSKVVKSYRRTDFLDQRRVLMCRWADHVTGETGKVVKLVGAG
ncbi:tyrosine-type recombinase/integrase [Rhodobaculum claviforme]|uniref:Integrase n=1 Tax=Rhodobaculum claviforme TaxID=1549854 RepID=A0A934TJD3_9RHOB|nr:site-specific integrase [Rhodobaculum claviforme]MBK5926860.1 integrase [Rhodobaculum claviforme]